MSKKEKLMQKLYASTNDFSFLETDTLLKELGFQRFNKGKTSGSRVCYQKGRNKIYLHRPHGRKNLLLYQVKYLRENLEGEN